MVITGTFNTLNGLWTFIVRDALTSELLYVGCERLKTIPALRELKRHATTPLPDTLSIELIAPVEDDSTLATLRSELQPRYARTPQTPQTPVQCDQTGEVFDNPAQAAKAYGIATAQLYMHLRHRERYKTCKGLTFKYA